jgi:hypothetical protein
MMRLGLVPLVTTLMLALAGSGSLRAEPAAATPDFQEVYDLIREHLADVSPADLNQIAVQSLLSALGPKASLVGPATENTNDLALVSKSSLFDGPIAYLRVSRVTEGLDQAVRQSWQALAATNKLNGMVLDLRYASGTDYAAAAATADLFIRKEQPLFDWGQGMVRSKEKTESISTPLAVLVNKQTAAAAEALAAALRETGAGLILGSRTAGAAMIAQEYPLKDGERLRIAASPIQLGDGTNLTSQGIKPDIAVEVSAADERAYYADAYKELSRPGPPIASGVGAPNVASGTNRTRRPRFNEAELVRERRNGVVADADISADGGDTDRPVIRDPVLSRALDFLKGLSVIRQTRY